MSRLAQKSQHLRLRKQRVRGIVSGTTARPRLSVSISNHHISAQIIDDTKQSTLAAVTTVGSKEASGNMTERAAWVGTLVAERAKKAKVKTVVFDRNGRLYHGRIKALAEAARKAGLEF